jgi:lactoylglutathione lyase
VAEWDKQIGAINLIVDDLERSTAFYRDVFGLPLLHEDDDSSTFRFEDTYVFLQHGDVRDLAERGVGQFAVIVGDVDAVHAELAERGAVPISGPADRDWGMRTMTFADPGGTTWEIAQPLRPG